MSVEGFCADCGLPVLDSRDEHVESGDLWFCDEECFRAWARGKDERPKRGARWADPGIAEEDLELLSNGRRERMSDE